VNGPGTRPIPLGGIQHARYHRRNRRNQCPCNPSNHFHLRNITQRANPRRVTAIRLARRQRHPVSTTSALDGLVRRRASPSSHRQPPDRRAYTASPPCPLPWSVAGTYECDKSLVPEAAARAPFGHRPQPAPSTKPRFAVVSYLVQLSGSAGNPTATSFGLVVRISRSPICAMSARTPTTAWGSSRHTRLSRYQLSPRSVRQAEAPSFRRRLSTLEP